VGGFVVDGAEVAEGGVAAGRVVERSIQLKFAWASPARVGQVCRLSSSRCSEAKNDPATVLSTAVN